MSNQYIEKPTLQNVVAGTSGSKGQIVRDGTFTLAYVIEAYDTSHRYVQLPADSEVGDVVEVYCDGITAAPTVNAFVYPPDGETFVAATTNSVFASTSFRKLSSTVWGYFYGSIT